MTCSEKKTLLLFSRYKDSKHPAYIKAAAVAKKEIKCAKKNFETKLCKNMKDNIKKDTKSFYAYVRSQSKTKVKVGPLIGEFGSTITDSKEMAEVLNNYFSSVYMQEDTSSIPEPEQIFCGRDSDFLTHITIDSDTVKKKLEAVRPDKTPGPDQSSHQDYCRN